MKKVFKSHEIKGVLKSNVGISIKKELNLVLDLKGNVIVFQFQLKREM